MPKDRIIRSCLIILTTVAVAFALAFTRTIMIPFILAIFLALIIEPLIARLQDRHHLPRTLAVTIGILILGLGGALSFFLIATGIRQLMDNAELYQLRFTEMSDSWLTGLASFGLLPESKEERLASFVANIPLFAMMRSVAETAIQGISDTFLIGIFVIFLLGGSTRFTLPKEGLWGRIDRGIRSYLITKTIVSIAVGFLSWAVLAIFKLDMAPMFGFLAFLLNFIPNIGSTMATLLPLPVAILQYGEAIPVLSVILIPAFVHFVIGNIIEPKLLGHNLDLHPITVLLTLMFWGLIWGVAGMILATPLTVVIKIILENQPSSQQFAHWMAGRWSAPPDPQEGQIIEAPPRAIVQLDPV